MLGGFKSTLLGSSGTESTTLNSLDFEASSTQYLSMSQANFGNLDTRLFAISVWAKRESTGNTTVFALSDGATTSIGLNWQPGNQLQVLTNYALDGSQLITTATYTDTADFHHIYAIYDSANATEADRIRLYYDGSRVSGFGTEVYPAQNTDFDYSGLVITLIRVGRGTAAEFDGLLYDLAIFSGTVPSVTTLYNGGTPPAITQEAGLYSHLNLGGGNTVEEDGVLVANWTNNNGVIASSTIPT